MSNILDETNAEDIHHYTDDDMPKMLQWSESLRKLVDVAGRFGSWFIIPLVLITIFDLGLRKTGEFQLFLVENVTGFFGSTFLQELEWHSHTVLFCLVLGYGYIWNTHVRVDLVRENLAFSKKLWCEWVGLTFFFVPYLFVLLYFAVIYSYDSFVVSEISTSQVGLTHRWIIKSVLAIGIAVAIVAGISVWLQITFSLFGPKNVRFPMMTVEWPEEEGGMVEGKERLDFSKTEDILAKKAEETKIRLAEIEAEEAAKNKK
jgi:TRAP-type mannitol/chloroaromatic compound transport system permease small subunit